MGRILDGFDARKTALCLGIPVKKASNLLRRLHSMGFLKRARTRRFCVPFQGRECYRGFRYIYKFSKQGVSYLKWLRETMPLEDEYYTRLTFDILSSLPDKLKDELTLLSLTRSAFKYHGPTRQLHLFDNNTAPVITLSIKNQQLAEENEKLQIENILLKSKLDQTEKEWQNSQQREKTLYQLYTIALAEASKIKQEKEQWKAMMVSWVITEPEFLH